MPRVAILIDGDNLSPVLAPDIAAIGQRLGDVHLHRVYANATHCLGWNEVPGVRFVHAGNGKNSADLLLAIQAMEFACTEGYETFLLASSDGDFTHLATRLCERGHTVVGAGEAKAPPAFRAACTRFEELERASDAPPGLSKPGASKTNAVKPGNIRYAVTDLDWILRNVIAEHSENGQGMRLSELNGKMHPRYDVKISTFPEGNWRNYLATRDTLFSVDDKGPDARVRVLPDGFVT